MFTGIIQGCGRITGKRPSGGGMVFAIEAGFDLIDPSEGESIAVNGVCLTAREIRGRHFLADVSPESLSRTNLGSLTTGNMVNLERALRLADRLGGHLVSGHVDAVTKVLERSPMGNFVRFTLAVPTGLGRYIIEKGSIAVDGISLTVNQCDERTFSLAIIPHTLEITTLGQLRQGDTVNIEVDLIGKYVEKLLIAKDNLPQGTNSGITHNFLAENGFLR